MISVVIVDDHSLVRSGMRLWLESDGDIGVVGEASSGAEAIAMVRSLHPVVLLQDLILPDMNGVDVIRALRAEGSDVKILAITGHDRLWIDAVRDAGGDGYLTKNERRETLIEAVRWAADGKEGLWISPSVVADYLAAQQRVAKLGLTPTELRVLRLIELTNDEIASRLFLAPGTVRNMVTIIYDKMGIHSRRQVLEMARSLGLIPPGNAGAGAPRG